MISKRAPATVQRCRTCRERPVVSTRPRVEFCHHCLPGGPEVPPPCRRCGSHDYFSAGLCGRCHPLAPQPYESCRDCAAWGVRRHDKWLCTGCRSWRQRFAPATCRICRTAALPTNRDQTCRLCHRQALLHPTLTSEQANADGQQLFLASIAFPAVKRTARAARHAGGGVVASRPVRPVTHQQLTLLQLPRDLRRAQRLGTLPEPVDPDLARELDAAARDHALRHGWPNSTTKRTRKGIQVLVGLQDTPGAPLRTSDIMDLLQLQLSPLNVLEVAAGVGLLLDDREPTINAWFTRQVHGLPEPMVTELTAWFTTMTRGSTSPPRRRARSDTTTRAHLLWALPALRAWTTGGHRSLRQVTPTDVRAVLPSSGNPRSTMGAGLRSVFTILRGLKVLFVNPIARVRTGGHERRQPLPLDVMVIREALDSPDPARAALAALAAFHALRTADLRDAHLTDISDGRLRIRERDIPLADPVQVRVGAWLTYRNKTWPNSANSHLFINHWTATRTDPVGRRWLSLTLNIKTSALREDRILHEIHATGGDVRRICDLFGLTVSGAIRYLPALEPDLQPQPGHVDGR